ncbi:hypothetical protein DQ238_11440 [Geodermatophilus sp. TF02-6]|uniref:AfsR/SARP family transcriptional regulator n=1 Tax=Geodermatophilus sp. TF02-6 TaxID=2250575 RepID=UPI000DE85CEA|nr:BTAD domain-containing putative transcriptional regulator [Geodermatophilus sp. TF02-6]RBY78684.1 hypothetical protein DQ238_11440 [Geodermatophilus sp. TF02-6]
MLLVLVRDLGSMAVEAAGAEIVAPGRKAGAILAVLTIHQGRRVSSSTLIDALWGDQVTAGTTSTLESHVWRLRQLLEPRRGRREPSKMLINDAGGYRLLVSPDQIDSAQLERMVDNARGRLAAGAADIAIELVDTALELWRGRPYTPFSDEQWAVAAVARLEESLQQARELRLDALVELGRTAEALADSESLIAEPGFREHTRAQRMLALHRAGRSDEALQTFQEFRRQLSGELGLEPGVELVSLQRRILDQDATLLAPREPIGVASAPQAATIHLPGRPSALIGRESELHDLLALVTSGAAVTVTGPAGCGKTRLAIDVARDLAPRFPEGVWFVDLAAVDTAIHVPEMIMTILGFGSGITGTPLEALAGYLQRRRILLVLDNCEHLLPELTPAVETLLGSATCWSSVLATSREPLQVDGETVWPLQPLALPDPDGRTDRPPTAAVELFLARAVAADSSLTIEGNDLRTVETICTGLDGLPLAIELAAARVRTYSLDEISEQVARNPVTLSRLGRSSRHDHHRSVGEAIEWSVQLLGPTERRVHEELSVLPGRFTARAARAVTEVVPDDEQRLLDVDELLPMLVNRSLLVREQPTRKGGRSTFRQLATVRAHAAHLLDDRTEDLLDRRDSWVLGQINALPRFAQLAMTARYDDLEDDYAAIRASLQRTLVERRDPAAAVAPARLALYWYFREELLEGTRWLESAADLTADPRASDGSRVLSHLACAVVLLFQARPDLACSHVDASVPLLAGLDGPDLLAAGDLLPWLAVTAAVAEQSETARAILERTRTVIERTGDDYHQAHARAARCLVSALLPGQTSQLDLATEARDAYARGMDVEHLMAAWMSSNALALTALRTASPDEGLVWARRAIDLSMRLGARRGGTWLELIADLMTMARRHHRAVQLFSAASAASSRAGTRFPRLPISRDLYADVRGALSRSDFDGAWGAGQSLTLEQIVADDAD